MPSPASPTDAPQRSRFSWTYFASPATFYPLAGAMIPWFAAAAALLCAAGLYVGFFVGAAWMSMFLYVVMAFWAVIGLAWNTRLAAMMASAIAPTGALFTFLALWT